MGTSWPLLAKWVAGTSYPRAPRPGVLFDFLRRVGADIFSEALERTQYARPEDIAAIQQKRLQILLRRVTHTVPRYRGLRLAGSTEEVFQSILPVSKEAMRVSFDSGTAVNRDLLNFGIPQYTSGSTGVPLNFYLDRNMLGRRLAVYRRMLAWVGISEGDQVVRLIRKEHPGLEGTGMWFPCGGPQELEGTRRRLYGILKGKSTVLQAQTSNLIRLAQLIEDDQERFVFRGIISYTEPLRPEIRSFLQRVFGAPIFDYYASNEITAIAQECGRHDGLHVNSEWVRLEILGDDNRPKPPGETGDIVVTAFENEVMPFIRYRTGDRGYWIEEECPCGRTLPRIRVEGREIYSFRLPDGTIGYFFGLVRPILQRIAGVFQYQIVRHTPERFSIRIVPTVHFTKEDEAFILEKCSEYLGKIAKVSISRVQQIEVTAGGKLRPFLNEFAEC